MRCFLLILLTITPVVANPEITVQLPGDATMDFVWVEAGAFTMGMTAAHVARLLTVLNEHTEGGGFRLPTDAEWEYASRAGTTSLWYFGDDVAGLADNAWNRDLTAPQPVGTKQGNPWGLHDMHGLRR